MVDEDKKLDFDQINWHIRGVLYRGNAQHHLERKILTSFTETGKATYRGNSSDFKSLDRTTFVTPWPVLSFTYPISQVEQGKFNERGGDIFTFYPCVIAINAEPYKDQIFDPSQGEGFVIKGDISADDIRMLFAKGIDRTSMITSEDRESFAIGNIRNSLLREINECSRLSSKSFLDKYHSGKITTRDIFYNLFMAKNSHSRADLSNVRKAIKYLEDFYRKS